MRSRLPTKKLSVGMKRSQTVWPETCSAGLSTAPAKQFWTVETPLSIAAWFTTSTTPQQKSLLTPSACPKMPISHQPPWINYSYRGEANRSRKWVFMRIFENTGDFLNWNLRLFGENPQDLKFPELGFFMPWDFPRKSHLWFMTNCSGGSFTFRPCFKV